MCHKTCRMVFEIKNKKGCNDNSGFQSDEWGRQKEGRTRWNSGVKWMKWPTWLIGEQRRFHMWASFKSSFSVETASVHTFTHFTRWERRASRCWRVVVIMNALLCQRWRVQSALHTNNKQSILHITLHEGCHIRPDWATNKTVMSFPWCGRHEWWNEMSLPCWIQNRKCCWISYGYGTSCHSLKPFSEWRTFPETVDRKMSGKGEMR